MQKKTRIQPIIFCFVLFQDIKMPSIFWTSINIYKNICDGREKTYTIISERLLSLKLFKMGPLFWNTNLS